MYITMHNGKQSLCSAIYIVTVYVLSMKKSVMKGIHGDVCKHWLDGIQLQPSVNWNTVVLH